MDNQKKEYSAPELKELGDFSKITQFNWVGENTDGAFPDSIDEAFDS